MINVITRVSQLLECERKIFIYGTGFRAKILYHFMMNKGKNILGFVTTEKEKGVCLYGKTVETIWNIADNHDIQDATFIIAVQNKYWDEIYKTLSVLQVKANNIYCLDYCSMISRDGGIELDEMLTSLKTYSSLQDEKSRLIYSQGVKYKLTGEYCYFLESFDEILDTKENETQQEFVNLRQWLINKLYKNEDKKIALYVPNWFWIKFSYSRLNEMGIKIDCICTENENMRNRLAYGVPIVSLEQAAKYIGEGYLLIGTALKQFTSQVRERLLDCGFSKQNIVISCSDEAAFNFGPHYFELEEMKKDKEEVFVDAGCLDCDTDIDFIKWCGNDYKHIFAFEPDKKSYDKCIDIVKQKKIQNITIINKGLWDCEAELNFSSNSINAPSSKITAMGTDVIETIALDDYLKGTIKVTFIKMDIEGAEMEALKGAEETIKAYKPKLAISIYHKINDFVDIPEYLLSIVPEYKFYIRHYSCYKYETVLYAMI